MEAKEGTKANIGETLDVRPIPPPSKHSTIFGKYTALSQGQSFTLVNDHDPKPLYYHFSAEFPGRFEWEYLESGPDVWRVRIGKPKG